MKALGVEVSLQDFLSFLPVCSAWPGSLTGKLPIVPLFSRQAPGRLLPLTGSAFGLQKASFFPLLLVIRSCIHISLLDTDRPGYYGTVLAISILSEFHSSSKTCSFKRCVLVPTPSAKAEETRTESPEVGEEDLLPRLEELSSF